MQKVRMAAPGESLQLFFPLPTIHLTKPGVLSRCNPDGELVKNICRLPSESFCRLTFYKQVSTCAVLFVCLWLPLLLQANGVGFSNCSLLSGHETKPSRRMEVSPPRTPTSPPSRFSRSAFFYSTYSHPPPSHPRCLLPDYSFCSDSLRPYAFSEVRTSVPRLQTSAPPPLDLLQSKSCGQRVRRSSSRSRWQAATTAIAAVAAANTTAAVVEEEEEGEVEVEVKGDPKQTAQGQSAETPPGVQTNGSLAWLAKVRSSGQQLQRLTSCESKGTSVEVDAEPLIQKSQAHILASML